MAKLLSLGKKKNKILLFCTQLFVTLAWPNFFDLKVQSAKASPLHSEKLKFIWLFSHFFVTLQHGMENHSY